MYKVLSRWNVLGVLRCRDSIGEVGTRRCPLTESDAKFLLGIVDLEGNDVVMARKKLMEYAELLCWKVEETELPPFRDINHTIPLIDEEKTYQWWASRCPEIFRGQWAEKCDAYLKSGRWKMTTARNTVPMLLIPKPHKPKRCAGTVHHHRSL